MASSSGRGGGGGGGGGVGETPAAHQVFSFDGEVVFSSNFDNGNLARVERSGSSSRYDFKIWTAPDNMGSSFQSKHCAWFHFVVTGVPAGSVLRIQIANASNHSGLYKHDMRPVYRSAATNQKWCRIKNCVRFVKQDDVAQLFFEHAVDTPDDKIYFAFTYPYTYTQLQQELQMIDASQTGPDWNDPEAIYWCRELLTTTQDGRRVDLLTISSTEGVDGSGEREPSLSGIFPDTLDSGGRPRPCRVFPRKEIIFVSARVHPGEVPAQHTLKGIINLLLDKTDLIAKEIRRRYVVKIVPMLNPDGVFRGHFRMDQFGQNLNRYYVDPDFSLQGPIFAVKTLLDYYASSLQRLSLYLDLHAHASKRGCFMYGNVMDTLEDQVQNMLYCRLVALNTPHFDYEGCLFSREHMSRIDPGDMAKGLTAEGSGRVANFLAYGIIHSYTLECNYNCSRSVNEVPPCEQDPQSSFAGNNTPASPFSNNQVPIKREKTHTHTLHTHTHTLHTHTQLTRNLHRKSFCHLRTRAWGARASLPCWT